MVAGGSVDQLGSDPDAIARLSDAAFEDVADAKTLGYILHVERLALERESGVPSDDRQCRNVRQVGDDVFTDSVAEILLLRLAAHVGERKHADGEFRLRLGGFRRIGRILALVRPARACDGVEKVLDAFRLSVAVPRAESDSVKLPKSEWRLHRAERYRH